MLDRIRFCVLGSTWHPHCDHWLLEPGRPTPTAAECIAAAARVEGLTGIELVHPSQIKPANLDEVKGALARHGLIAASVAASISSLPCYLGGSLTADDSTVRQQAIGTVKTAMDLAAELGAGRISLFLGRDGFDYAFQTDYDVAWGRLVDGLQAMAAYRPEVRISIEYKLKDPRRHLFAATAAKTLMLIAEVGAANLGVLLDAGHALYSGDSLAETVAMLSRAGKLFHVHFNDISLSDDNMIIGSVHFLEILEMLYWLDRTDYEGWLSVDPHPILEDPTQSVAESLRFVQGLIGVLDRLGRENVEAAISSHQVTEIMSIVWAQLFAR